MDRERLQSAYRVARRDLMAEQDASGHWIGELSTSALSTATATSALSLVLRNGQDYPQERLKALIDGGVAWLAKAQNPDGGFGDTDKSLSNIATTMLVRAALHLAGAADAHRPLLDRAEKYLEAQGGIAGLRHRYGKDKTFAVPILTNCALAGLVEWREVAPLPFELAALPNRVLGLLRIPVVSYAIPALVAIGQARYFHGKPRNPLARLVRRLAIPASLRTLQRMQPASGGYLEAAPLTSFVAMSMASIGQADHPVTRRAVQFLIDSVRPDGSWPIDTNLATWVTSLSINALAAGGQKVGTSGCLAWLLNCQHRQVHPFTSAAPGGWGWTDLSGAVPDADDTPGALLALAVLRPLVTERQRKEIDLAAFLGLNWLFNLQNSDGGWPTFCRGWGTLPFDRSGVDLTAHAIRAIHTWQQSPPNALDDDLRLRFSRQPLSSVLLRDAEKAIRRGLDFLARRQRPDGSFVPLWFGNQHHPAEENPVYGTSRVLLAYRDLGQIGSGPAQRALAWLAGQCGPDGGWGASGDVSSDCRGVSSVEETAVAVEALLAADDAATQAVAEKGLNWLVEAIEAGRHREPSPIGLYFARLWYYERLYPRCMIVSALGHAVSRHG
jgi:squalene-hopene/tetraprenyl-beta-curcumene cyclase